MTELRGQEAWTLTLMQSHGRHEDALKYLDALNALPRALGLELFDMPLPFRGPMEGLITAPAEQLTECHGDPLLRRVA